MMQVKRIGEIKTICFILYDGLFITFSRYNETSMFTEDDDAFLNQGKLEQQPIYQKSMDILQMVLALKEYIDPKDDLSMHTMQFMIEDAMKIPPKLAGAMSVELYDLKMENAAIIRQCARQIKVSTNGFRDISKETDEYLDLLRNEIDEFRLLFIDWVEGFDPWMYIIDRWGLFNPPGVSAHDKDPDDDIPLGPKDES